MRPSLVIGLTVLVVGALVLIWQHDSGLVGGIDNERFASVVAMVALVILLGGAAFSGRLREDVRNILIWLTLAGMLVFGYAYRDLLVPVATRVTGELVPAQPQVSGDGVSLRRDASGHFRARARVNGENLDMLVDTGASRVALSFADAQAVGLDMDALNFVTPVSTANGEVLMARTTLWLVEIGPVAVNDVTAFVAPRGALSGSLLGESFLSRLAGYTVRGDTLTLQPR